MSDNREDAIDYISGVKSIEPKDLFHSFKKLIKPQH